MNGPKGKNGPIASCPMCGKDVTEITWDAELDVCTCGNCGRTNGSENLDLYPTDPGPKTPMTNAQRIRAMTDEELAEFLCSVYDEEPVGGYKFDHAKFIEGYTIPDYDEDRIKDWLQQPCGGADHE